MTRANATVVVVAVLALCSVIAAVMATGAPNSHTPEPLDALIQAYPQHLKAYDGQNLVWQDGTRMPTPPEVRAREPEQRLSDPDIIDMLAWDYDFQPPTSPPPTDADPGRARHQPFFIKMYGDCRQGEVAPHLEKVDWLPETLGRTLSMTRVNGAAQALRNVSRELDQLDPKYLKFLDNPAGTYNCRTIAGTDRLSMHAFGAAVDINVSRANYWRWAKPDDRGQRPWQNQIPYEIVEIFERHGFIWGGRWHHFDTMHFEYRPEFRILDARTNESR